jgi:glucosyl-3-phosphoglycerate synthase
MEKRYVSKLFKRILVPVAYGMACSNALAAARWVVGEGEIYLLGLVGVPQGESLSEAALLAREVRTKLRASAAKSIRPLERIRVSHFPWDEIINAIRELRADLLVMEQNQFDILGISIGNALRESPCDMVIAFGEFSASPRRVLVPLRGGPSAELSLRIGLAVADHPGTHLTTLHLVPDQEAAQTDRPFRGLEQVLRSLPDVRQIQLQTTEPIRAILDKAHDHDLIVMGATAQPEDSPVRVGPVARQIIEQSGKGVLLTRSARAHLLEPTSESVGRTAISVLVDKWFAENTYHADEFIDLHSLLERKRQQNLTISLALPALNEEETVGNVIQTLKSALMDEVPLLDEIVLIDSNSTDRTREIARELGIPVYIHQEVLSQYGPRRGKGEALWKSLYLTRGDLIIWVDTDIVNIHPRFVYGLLGPLITRPDIQFVKGFYRRPLKVGETIQAAGGGRVTELTARPLLNLFYPELSGVIQPLSGEYGGRRSALEQLPFSSGYGVEIGLLIDLFEKFGLSAIAQVDLQERIHHNQPLESLSKMSFAIIQSVVRRLERRYGMSILEDVNKTMKLIRYERGRLFLEIEEIAEQERPAMVELPEYRQLTPVQD